MVPERTNNAIVKVGHFGGRAIDKRRLMLNIPEVSQALSMSEKTMFAATTKTTIGEYDTEKLIENISKLVEYLARDLGIRGEIDGYSKTRFYDILVKYYSDLTLTEIKSAFEISLMGELDKYLPKNGNGEPDKNHYQSFSVEFISKILNAYRKRRNEIIIKAHEAIPLIQKTTTPEEIKKLNNELNEMIFKYYLEYKDYSKVELTVLQEKLIFDKFIESSLCKDIEATIEDKNQALKEIVGRFAASKYDRLKNDIVRSHGIEHTEVKQSAYSKARSREIRNIFDGITQKKLDIKKLLK